MWADVCVCTGGVCEVCVCVCEVCVCVCEVCVCVHPRMLQSPVYGEQKCQCCYGPLPPRQLLHGAVPLPWGDDVVVDASTEGLLEERGRGGGGRDQERRKGRAVTATTAYND